jgi:hypothetical protein
MGERYQVRERCSYGSCFRMTRYHEVSARSRSENEVMVEELGDEGISQGLVDPISPSTLLLSRR